MKSSAEELKISINPSKPSSEYEDSLTSKLNNILHSSDEIIVQPSELFKPSNEHTEQDPISSEEAKNPAAKPNTKKKPKRNSNGSFASLGTVFRHETPNAIKKKTSKTLSLRSERKNSMIEKEIWQFFQKVVRKNPEFKELVRQDKDFEVFFLKKFREFEEILKENIRKNSFSLKKNWKTREKNKELFKKTEEIRERIQEDDLERVRESFKRFEDSCRFRLKQLVDLTLRKYQNLKMIEDCKLEFEYKNTKKTQKQTIIENIKNYYNDKIKIFKENLEERKLAKAVIDHEHRIAFSEARRERIKERKAGHKKSLDLVNKKLQKMKAEMEDEEQLIQRKIIKLYKHSARSVKKF